MRSYLDRVTAALLCAALVFAALPALAKPTELQDNSFQSELGRLAATLKNQTEKAGEAAAAALQEGRGLIADVQSDVAKQLDNFRYALNEQKAELGMIAEDAAARLKAWSQSWAEQSWAEQAWAEMTSDIHRAATEALDRLHDWIAKQTASEDPAPISI